MRSASAGSVATHSMAGAVQGTGSTPSTFFSASTTSWAATSSWPLSPKALAKKSELAAA